jgi:hypothetical protein
MAWNSRLMIVEGYAMIWLAEQFCSGVPLTTVPLFSGSPTYTRGFTTTELLERAVTLFDSAIVAETGRLFIATDIGLGVVHTLDMETAADAIEQGHWTVTDLRGADLPQRFGHCLSPQAQAEPKKPVHMP